MSKSYFTKRKRTAVGLRDYLFDELDRFRAGKSSAQNLTAVSRIAHQIIASVRLERDAGGGLLILGTQPLIEADYEVTEDGSSDTTTILGEMSIVHAPLGHKLS